MVVKYLERLPEWFYAEIQILPFPISPELPNGFLKPIQFP